MELRAHFRPEFLNRVDDIIIFHSLDEKQLAHIVDIQLAALEKRSTQQQLTLDVDTLRAKSCSPKKATIRNSARAPSSAPSRNYCSIRSRPNCSSANSNPATTSKSPLPTANSNLRKSSRLRPRGENRSSKEQQ